MSGPTLEQMEREARTFDGIEMVPLKEWTPRVLPARWTRVEHPLGAPREYAACFVCHSPRMSVILDASVQEDGKRWAHVSVASPDRLPTYDELVEIKETFIGADRHALMKLPPRRKHVNIHPNCLHLFSCLDGDVTPDFTRGGMSL